MKSAQVGIFLNSIEMMESGRCGRRKQRNPKRKNVENGVDGDEPGEVTLDDNKNQIVSTLSPSGSSYQSDIDDDDCNDNSLILDIKDDGKQPTAEKIEPSPEEKVSAILREIQQQQQQQQRQKQQQQQLQLAAPDSTSDGDKDVSQQTVRGDGKPQGKQTEDAKIAELLNRGDTAVIYPESVSDGDETHNNDEGGLSEEEIVLKCMHCPQTFLRAIVLRDHMREMHADKPLKFMCPKCYETFHQKSQLDKHLTLHSPTSQICTVCNKTFANVYRLQRHMISHNESTDLRKFKCPECGKAFKFKHHLKEHVRIHSGEKPFVCNNCGKRFSHSGSFSSHTTSKKCYGLSAHKARVGQEGMQNLGQTVSQSATQSLGSLVQKMSVSFPSSKITQFPRSSLPSVPVTMAHQHQQHFMSNPYSQQKGIPPFFYPPQMFASPDGFLHPIYSQTLPTHLQHSLTLPSLPGMKPSQADQDSSKERLSESPHPSVSSGSSMSRSTRSLSPHSQSTRSFSPHSHSGRSVSPYSISAFSLSSPPPSHSRGRSTTPGSLSYRGVTPTSERVPSHSPHSHSEQISPDVNSNTKLLLSTEKSVSEPMSTYDEIEKTTGEQSEAKSADSETENMQVKTETVDNEAEHDMSVTSQSDNDKTTKRAIPCHYCGEVFESPVAQHQHERYMCKHNKDVVQNRASHDSCQSPHSTVSDISHVESTPNGSVGNDTDEEEVEELYKDTDVGFDEKKMRIRSLFTEEQQAFLKSQYSLNPRPRKYELIRMGNRIGFPKRVVQVWFQNMRARERKQGRELSFSSPAINFARIKSEHQDRELSKSPTYIPNVPKLPSMLGLSSKTTAVLQPNPPCQSKVSPGEAPLDLSVRKTPPLAHGGSVSRLSTPDSSHDDQVLNLSVKKEKENSVEKETTENYEKELASHIAQKRLQDSAIFKYMQQEGMMNKRLPHLTGTISPSLAHTLQNQLYNQSMASVLKMPTYTTSSDLEMNKINSSASLLFDSAHSSEKSNKFDSVSCSRLVIDEAIKEANSQARDSTPPFSRVITQSHNAQITSNSNLPHMKMMSHEALPEDTHNLATLAEAAQRAANIMSGKPKRLRKKTWRQVESEQVQLDFEDSTSTDEDQPLKKKRKSWKNHRVDREEGLYGCDQCNKVFSKQSSLARHKYEHSGARPFACDMCTKSFKHKHHLTEHKRLHSGEKPFQCKKCGKRFSHSGSFSQHMNHRYNYCSPHKTSDGDGDLSSQESP